LSVAEPDFDAPPTPEELDEMRRLREGLERFPLGGHMVGGGKPAQLPAEDRL
jgi:hypothetical protein